MTSLAQQLMGSLEKEEQNGISIQELDRQPDVSGDEPEYPVSGREMMQAGKFKEKSTMAEAYLDKSHVKWVRNNINVQSGAEMRRYRLYVEMRDQVKMQRIHREREGRVEAARRQMPKTRAGSSTVTKAKAKPAPVRFNLDPMSQRRGREEDGWATEMSGYEMDMEEWETNVDQQELTDETVNEWFNLIEAQQGNQAMKEKMEKVAEIMGIGEALKMFMSLKEEEN
jgi:hypothetical protein